VLDMRVYSSRQQGEISRLFVSKFLSGPYYTDLPCMSVDFASVKVVIKESYYCYYYYYYY